MTNFAIIASTQDKAGMNIAAQLMQRFGFTHTPEKFDGSAVWAKENLKLYFINEAQIYADYATEIPADVLVFASKHKSESAKPTLTVHAIGSWGKAEMGGRAGQLVPTSANLIKNYLLSLEKQRTSKKLNYEVSLECTHHGPFLTKPAVFIELGSSEEQWLDSIAGQAIAEVIANHTSLSAKPVSGVGSNDRTIAEVIANHTSLSGNPCTALAFGGGHYCPEFTKLLLRTNYATSHICPKYALPDLSEEMLCKALESSLETVQEFVIDSKGLGNQKQHVMKTLNQQGLPVNDVRKLIKIS